MREITNRFRGGLPKITLGSVICIALLFLMSYCKRNDPRSAMKMNLYWLDGYPVHREDIVKVQDYVYFYGNFLEKSVNAKEYNRVSVEAFEGNTESQLQLCAMYVFGVGAPKDSVMALKWCQKAADDGNASAQNKLGLMHALAIGVTRNYGENYRQANHWFQKAADHGDIYGRVNLCEMHRLRVGRASVDECREELSSYSTAAEHGNVLAQYKMGEILYRKQRFAESAMWLEKVAEKDSLLAQMNLAYEPPRVLRRLLYLREWSHEKAKQIFPGSTRARCSDGARASW